MELCQYYELIKIFIFENTQKYLSKVPLFFLAVSIYVIFKLRTTWKTYFERYYDKKIKTFIYENPQKYLSREQFCELWKYYEKWKYYGVLKYWQLEEVLAYIAARAFWSNIEDSTYVTKILHDLKEKWLYSVYLMHLYHHANEVMECELIEFLEFFLTHAKRRRCRLVYAENLVIWCGPLYTQMPEIFLVILRHNACEDHYLRLTLNAICFLIHYNSEQICHSSDSSFKTKMKRLVSILIRCGNVILKACGHISNCETLRYPCTISEEALKNITDNVLPGLELRIGKPVDLKQACRLSIRQILHERWLLPDGIDRLPVPQCLKNYLNLLCD